MQHQHVPHQGVHLGSFEGGSSRPSKGYDVADPLSPAHPKNADERITIHGYRGRPTPESATWLFALMALVAIVVGVLAAFAPTPF